MDWLGLADYVAGMGVGLWLGRKWKGSEEGAEAKDALDWRDDRIDDLLLERDELKAKLAEALRVLNLAEDSIEKLVEAMNTAMDGRM